MLGRELVDKMILGAVRVLVLVDEDVPEALLVVLEDLRVVAEQSDALHDDVVEVERAGGSEPLLIGRVEVGDRPLVERAGLGGELRGRDEVVLGPADHRRHRSRRIPLGVDVHLLLHDGDGPFGVALVVDGEVAGHSEVGVFPPEDAGAGRVEG